MHDTATTVFAQLLSILGIAMVMSSAHGHRRVEAYDTLDDAMTVLSASLSTTLSSNTSCCSVSALEFSEMWRIGSLPFLSSILTKTCQFVSYPELSCVGSC